MDNQKTHPLRPTSLERIYDVVASAGIDVQAWHAGKGDFASNPSFCYRWAFEGEKTVLLCLWLDAIHWDDGAWVCRGNARAEQIAREAAGADHWDPAVRNRTKRWAMSAYQLDEVIKQAYRKKLEVRVCVIDSKSRSSDLEASSADLRALDPLPWSLTYDMLSGDYAVRRASEATQVDAESGYANSSTIGSQNHEAPFDHPPAEVDQDVAPAITPTSYGVGVVDQFVLDTVGQDYTVIERIERERSPVVRQAVMARSQGRCEWCDAPGFLKHDGQVYLESHHVVPLHAGGDDTPENVIALCPNDHRIAHYGERRELMAREMLARILDRMTGENSTN